MLLSRTFARLQLSRNHRFNCSSIIGLVCLDGTHAMLIFYLMAHATLAYALRTNTKQPHTHTHSLTNKLRCAKHARDNGQTTVTRGRGRGRGRHGGGRNVRGGGRVHPAGRHARTPCARGTVARCGRPAQIAATLKTELKLTAVSSNAADIDADEDLLTLTKTCSITSRLHTSPMQKTLLNPSMMLPWLIPPQILTRATLAM